jgi:sec-independent protein translocase protein TatC
MSERNLFSAQSAEHDSPPQPIPRAGMGIAPLLGITAPEDAAEHNLPANGYASNGQMEALSPVSMDETTAPAPDPATVPELAPLVSNAQEPMITSQPLDNFKLDEFDMAGGDGGDGNSGSNAEYSGGDDGFSSGMQDLFSHLAELRARILYSVAAVAVASCITWNQGKWIQAFLAQPILRTLRSSGMKTSQLVTLDPTEGFYLYFQITLASALLLAAPVVLFQMWRFIEPALTKTERRFTIVLVPFSVLLFFAGVVLGYLMAPIFFEFFVAFQPPESVAMFSYGSSVALLAKMLLVFGVCFQVPVITIFLNKIGVVSRNFLIEYWRHAVVLIFTVVAIITPTWDPVTLCACATPPCLLYVLSIWLVKWL